MSLMSDCSAVCEPKALDPIHQKSTYTPNRVEEAITCICVCRARTVSSPIVERRFTHVEQMGNVIFCQKAHVLRDSLLHFAISKAPAVMTVSASFSL